NSGAGARGGRRGGARTGRGAALVRERGDGGARSRADPGAVERDILRAHRRAVCRADGDRGRTSVVHEPDRGRGRLHHGCAEPLDPAQPHRRPGTAQATPAGRAGWAERTLGPSGTVLRRVRDEAATASLLLPGVRFVRIAGPRPAKIAGPPPGCRRDRLVVANEELDVARSVDEPGDRVEVPGRLAYGLHDAEKLVRARDLPRPAVELIGEIVRIDGPGSERGRADQAVDALREVVEQPPHLGCGIVVLIQR